MKNLNIGVIGYGSMGSMLVNSILQNEIINQENMYVSNRNLSKITTLKEKYPSVTITEQNCAVAAHSDILFVCVKPIEIKRVLEEIKTALKSNVHIVSIAGCITISDVENIVNGKITKVIPSITAEVSEGYSLVCPNAKVGKVDNEILTQILETIGKVKHIREEDFEIAADLTSCAPGLFSVIFDIYVTESLKYSSLTKAESQEMLIETLYGTIKLIKDKQISFEELLSRVATKGGITEEGAKHLKQFLPTVFDTTFETTLKKHETVKRMLNAKCIYK